MDIQNLINQSNLSVEPNIDVFVCDMNECRLVIDVINKDIAPNVGDLNFAALVNIEIEVDDRKLLLEEVKKYVQNNTLQFVPYASDELLEIFNQENSVLDENLSLNHQEEFVTPYSEEINHQLTEKIRNIFEKNGFNITYI